MLSNTTDRKIYNSLERWYLSATPNQKLAGLTWYEEAQNFTRELSERHNICRYKAAAVTSALSPNNRWSRNKVDAESIIETYVHLGPEAAAAVKVCTYNNNKLKAIKILEGSVELAAKSPKTHSFALNIGLLSNSHVTVDKHHIRACLVHPNAGKVDTIESVTPAQYRRIEAITVKLSRAYDMKAYEMQAVIWVTIRAAWGIA